jgi:hypothetical protein
MVWYVIAINLLIYNVLYSIRNIFNYLDNICDMKWFLRILRFLYCLLKEELITDWIQILITFRSACYFCRKEISPGQAFWSNSAKAAKHMVCNRTKAGNVITHEIETLQHKMSDDPIPSWANHPRIIDLKCFLCGAKTGCHECMYLNECVQRFTSEEYCVCKSCSSNSEGPGSYERYKQIFVQNAKTQMNV